MINRAIIIRGKVWGGRLRRRLNNPPVGIEHWMEQHTELVKEDSRRVVGYYHMRDYPCYLKLYRRRSPFHLLFYYLRMGRAARTFKTSVALSANGVPIPRPLSCVLVWEGVLLLSKGIAGNTNYAQLWQSPPPPEEAQLMMRGAGQAIASAHACGYAHGDCKWSNLLWSEGECYMVDLDAARKGIFAGKSRRAKDLASFTVAAEEVGVDADLLEDFLCSYQAATGDERDALLQRMRPHLKKLRDRHSKQYGTVAQPLI